ncbi:uncharacterized protein B0H18DRAFT_1007394 [Fomitopsis serialis]|uniref:uncharacterized protein n=1 Tax=Fomitopsis serialis TaxID=139415 RepID=UPI002007A22D|nr:uncharacterized protein B0H18DRAFT_1007394 [Neoantrodia serialis]KAH9926003.1 hypothetical protein B0H18DRAFT_1007394 [Neoantrodia serialis]
MLPARRSTARISQQATPRSAEEPATSRVPNRRARRGYRRPRVHERWTYSSPWTNHVNTRQVRTQDEDATYVPGTQAGRTGWTTRGVEGENESWWTRQATDASGSTCRATTCTEGPGKRSQRQQDQWEEEYDRSREAGGAEDEDERQERGGQ